MHAYTSTTGGGEVQGHPGAGVARIVFKSNILRHLFLFHHVNPFVYSKSAYELYI